MAFSDDGILELLYCVNLVIGVTLIAVGSSYYSTINKYNNLTEENINFLPSLVLITGLIVLFLLIIAVILLYFTQEYEIIRSISLIIFPALIIMQTCVGVYGVILATDSDREMLTGIQKQMRREFLNNEVYDKYSDSLNIIQKDLECCGVYYPEDYEPNPKLPASCCEHVQDDKFCEERRLRYRTGCAIKVHEKVTRSIGVTANVVLGAAIIQIAGLICLGKICCDK